LKSSLRSALRRVGAFPNFASSLSERLVIKTDASNKRFSAIARIVARARPRTLATPASEGDLPAGRDRLAVEDRDQNPVAPILQL
jgi:hypothetical protein